VEAQFETTFAPGNSLAVTGTNTSATILVDLDNNGVFNELLDFQISLTGGPITSLTYNFSDDMFHLS
jgi:hypothetical protein